jgi:glycerophosphoryl diester phosphodiesterase
VLAIAHRSGNTVDGLRTALDRGVDLVEADVHAYRGVLEIRHHKTLGSRHLWDKWQLVRRSRLVTVELSQLLDELGDDPRLMLDLKGRRPGLAHDVAAVLHDHAPAVPFTVCTKQWSMLDAFAPVVRRVLSAANRSQLAALRRRVVEEARAGTPAYGVSVRLRLLSPEIVAELQRSVEVVMAWPVDSGAALARARALRVDAVVSKDLALLDRARAD